MAKINKTLAANRQDFPCTRSILLMLGLRVRTGVEGPIGHEGTNVMHQTLRVSERDTEAR